MAFPGGFREYMAVKRQKLEFQGQQTAAAGSQSSILAGINVYFNGYTQTHGSSLTYLEFKELILTHGALVRDKLEGDVTHIIASQMTDSKMKQLRKPVVTPAWLLDSIKEKKLLNWLQYRLYTNVVASQKTLDRFGAHEETRVVQEPEPTIEAQPEIDIVEAEEEDEEEEVPDEAVLHFGTKRPQLNMDSEWVKANICTGPGFLQKYFNSSRLHHLSTWKSDLRDFVAMQQATLKRTVPRPNPNAIIMHVDMDCFFASVAVRERPDLRDRPVAVAHSAGTGGRGSTSEIASCNYAARAHGVRNGMSIGRAREMCKNLTVMPYEFENYDACSKALYTILLRYGDEVQAVSCDEAYLEVSSSIEKADALPEIALANRIRAEILEATGCRASIGIGSNMLIARMATKEAKPDGAHLVPKGTETAFMESQTISDLPGVGYVLTEKLAHKNIKTCKELSALSLSMLQKECGEKTGSMLYKACRGIDTRELENKPRQSVGAEINWGIRFQKYDQVEKFMYELTEEVVKRMKAASVKGKHITIKVKRKRYEGEPAKVLGCGDCDNLSKSHAFKAASDSTEAIFREGYRMLCEMQMKVDDIRGVGLHVSKLEGGAGGQSGPMELGQKTLTFGAGPSNDPLKNERKGKHSATEDGASDLFSRYGIKVDEIDWDVLVQLPADLQAEIKPYLEARATQQIRNETPPAPQARQEDLSPSKAAKYTLPTASQVDPEVLRALPDSIRKELEAAMKAPDSKRNIAAQPGILKRGKRRGSKISPGKGQLRFDQYLPGGGIANRPPSPSPPPAAPVIPLPEPIGRPALGSVSDGDMVRAMLSDWISSYRGGPDPEDVEAVIQYISNLVQDMELEEVDILLRWFKAKVGEDMNDRKGKGNGAWATIFSNLMAAANEEVKKNYGHPLKGCEET
ncbi:hypothetical protein DFJ77DRAFT_287498 [Powellomyces hirtus]|nr:hypothetical protein DFJ77DRAFT_287498 [Powellomyces hirtus]